MKTIENYKNTIIERINEAQNNFNKDKAKLDESFVYQLKWSIKDMYENSYLINLLEEVLDVVNRFEKWELTSFNSLEELLKYQINRYTEKIIWYDNYIPDRANYSTNPIDWFEKDMQFTCTLRLIKIMKSFIN